MNRKQAAILSAFLGLLVPATNAVAQPTVYPYGVTIHEEGVAEGYILFDAGDDIQRLIAVDGTEVHRWTPPGNARDAAKPLPDGHILITRGIRVVEMDWDGTIVWEYTPPSGVTIHHDHERLPNGNTLINCRHTINVPSISPQDIDEDFIIEVDPAGTIVWEWHPVDHLDDFGFPQERLDLMHDAGGNIFHCNAISSIPQNTSHGDPRFSPGNIALGYRNQNTIAIIDRLTGDVVWSLIDSVIGQHAIHMLPDDLPGGGNLLVFDNGWSHFWSIVPNRSFSRVVEIDPVTNAFSYIYTAADSGYPDDQFFSYFMSNAQRLPNGNTLIVESSWGRVFEVTPAGEIVWEYINPYFNDTQTTNRLYRAYKVPLEWAGPHFDPDLVVSGSATPDPAQAGRDLDYTIQVENVGSDPAITVELSGATPAGTTFRSVSGPSAWDCTTPAVGGTGSIACTVSNLSPGTATPLTIGVEVDPCHVDGTVIGNTVMTSSLGSDVSPGDNTTTIDVGVASDALIPDLALELINDGQDVRLGWGNAAPSCGYRVLRSTTSDGGFVDTSGLLFGNDYTDPGAGSSPENHYYLVRID